MGNMGMTTGPLLGEGFRATVHAYGDGRAVKVTRPSTPDSWLLEEYRCLAAVLRSGAPCPEGPALVELDDRLGLVTEWVEGPTMWQTLEVTPDAAADLGRALARLQRQVFALPPSFDLPRQSDRLQVKLRLAARTFGLDLEPLAEFLRDLDDGSPTLGVCHGDLHPHNVVMTAGRGPVLVDWFDAAAGLMAADIARTSVLLSTSSEDPMRRPSAALEPALSALRAAYLDDACAAAGLDADDLDRWVTVQLAARLAEGLGDARVREVADRLSRF